MILISMQIILGLSLNLCFFIPPQTGADIILCIERALALSGVSKEDENYINAHATSTLAGDLKDYQALIHCFGQNLELNFLFHVIMTIVLLLANSKAIRTGWVHPNINLEMVQGNKVEEERRTEIEKSRGACNNIHCRGSSNYYC
ncbi:Thiolase-like [Sesbania bispinosa]|nr:Thiolase-like [Sesbania bispinosa]